MRVQARGVLIDLDGTLLDTVPDLAAAVNAMLADFGRPPLPTERVAAYVGKGADVLVHRSLTGTLDGRAGDAEFRRGKDAFFIHYRRENGRQAVVFPGVRDAIALLRRRGLMLACVTNKPREFTHELLQRVGLADFDAIVSGDDTVEKKPHPAPMLHACRLLQIEPTEAAMVGDSENDVLSARAAGCRVIVVETGYNEGRPVSELKADAIVPGLLDAARLIEPPHASSPNRQPDSR
jgi:phosphoglycolate phosphatase